MSAGQMNSIDIDVGGTFTDLVMNMDGHIVQAKVPTTPYDLSVCFLNVIEVGAQELGLTLDQVLRQIGMVRYSTTIAMNRLIERKGPRLALLTTEGHEDAILIGRGAQWVDGTRLHERRNLAVQLGTGRALFPAVLEEADPVELRTADPLLQVLHVLFRLSRKPDDERRAHRDARNATAELLDNLQIALTVARPKHAAQYVRMRMLKRHVHVLAHLR